MSHSYTFQRFTPLSTVAPSHLRTSSRMLDWLHAAGQHKDLIVVIGWCAAGLLLSLAVSAVLPDFSSAIADISLTP